MCVQMSFDTSATPLNEKLSIWRGKPSKLSFRFCKWFFFVFLLPNLYLYMSHDTNLCTNESHKWSRLSWYAQRAFNMIFDVSATQLNEKLSIWEAKPPKLSFLFLKWFFLIILLPNLYLYVSHNPNLFTNVSIKWSRLFWYLQCAFKWVLTLLRSN